MQRNYFSEYFYEYYDTENKCFRRFDDYHEALQTAISSAHTDLFLHDYPMFCGEVIGIKIVDHKEVTTVKVKSYDLFKKNMATRIIEITKQGERDNEKC